MDFISYLADEALINDNLEQDTCTASFFIFFRPIRHENNLLSNLKVAPLQCFCDLLNWFNVLSLCKMIII